MEINGKLKIINMIYDETEWTSLNHTRWMNTSVALLRYEGICQPKADACVFILRGLPVS